MSDTRLDRAVAAMTPDEIVALRERAETAERDVNSLIADLDAARELLAAAEAREAELRTQAGRPIVHGANEASDGRPFHECRLCGATASQEWATPPTVPHSADCALAFPSRLPAKEGGR